MEVIIKTENVINDIGGTFLQELQSEDPIPPKGKLVQSLNEADARLRAIVGRRLEIDFRDSADDSLAINDSIVYNFLVSTRRSVNKAEPLAALIHSYLVNSVLAKTYSTMGQADLAALHEAQSVSDAQVISQLINSKIPPII